MTTGLSVIIQLSEIQRAKIGEEHIASVILFDPHTCILLMPGMYQGAEGLPSAPVAFIFVFPICPRHPGMGTPVPWEVHQAADLLLCAHGTLTPPRFSRGCPHCVIPEPRGCDWAEVSLYPFPHPGRRRVQARHLQLVSLAPGRLQRQYKRMPAAPIDHGEPLRRLLGK